MRRNLSIGCLALLLCSPAVPAGAQPSGSVAEKIDVNIVNVDLYVSDRKGNPMFGLAAKDFQLFEDEKKVKISNFSRVEDGADQQASLIIYVDDTHVSAGSRDNVLDALLPFIEGRMASEGTAVMVVHFGQILEVEQDFTRDPAAVRSAFDAIKLVEPVGEKNLAVDRIFQADAKQTMELLQGGTQNARLGRAALDGVLASALGYAESSRTKTILSAEALTALARSLGIRPGRKSLYFVGDGLALRPMGDMMTSFQRQIVSRGGGSGTGDASVATQTGPPTVGGQGSQTAQAALPQAVDSGLERYQEALQQLDSTIYFQRLGAIANASRVTLYPIKPPYVDASSAGLEKRSSSEQPLSNLREAMDLMADSTGGLSMVGGTNVVAFLDRTTEQSAAHYSLGFEPREKGQSGLHLLRLKGKSRSWRLRYRQSYVTKTPRIRLADRAVGTLTVHWVDNPHEIDLRVASESQADDGNYDVTVMLSVPISSLSLIAEEGIHRASCQVAVVVLNSEGQLSRPQYLELPIQIPSQDLENALQQDFGGTLTLRVPAGTQRLAIGFWEDGPQKGSFVSHEIMVGEA